MHWLYDKAYKRYTILSLSCVILLIYVLKLNSIDLTIPFIYSSDGLSHGFLIKTIIDTGWFDVNNYIGAPYGTNLLDYPQAEWFNFITIKLLSILSGGNFAITYNLYYLLGFFLALWAAYAVLISLGLSSLYAGVTALLFTFLPYHFLRVHHLLLVSYFVIPISTWLVYKVISPSPPFLKGGFGSKKENILIILAILLLGSNGVYYAFFASFFIIVGGITASLQQLSWKHFLSSGIFVFFISTILLMNLAPSVFYKNSVDINTEIHNRKPSEAEIYGLKITQLILPNEHHRAEIFGEITKKYNKTAPLINENQYASLGFIGSIGFLLLITANFINRRLFKLIPALEMLTFLNLSAILLGTIGGFGSLFAWSITPLIRGYNRISIFIAFFSLAAFFLFMQWLFQNKIQLKFKNFLIPLFAIIVLAFGLYDQTSDRYLPNRSQIKNTYQSDKNFIYKIENLLPDDSMVFQLPYIKFPEEPVLYKEGSYGLIRAYLHSKNIKWSYGAMKGREGDLILRAISYYPLDRQIDYVKALGFSGIYIERRAYKDHGRQIESQLQKLLGSKSIISDDENLAFYDLTMGNLADADTAPIMPVLLKGFWGWEGVPGRHTWSSGDAELLLINPKNNSSETVISFNLGTLVQRHVTVKIGDQHSTAVDLFPGKPGYFEIEFKPKGNKTLISFKTDVLPVQPGMSDQRYLSFSISNLKVITKSRSIIE